MRRVMEENVLENIIQKVILQVLDSAKQSTNTSSFPLSTIGIPVEISARHVHLSEADALALFGEPLKFARELSQPGQYLCEQRVRLIGPKGVLDNVAILGPARSASQIEISYTDARALGVSAPLRQSGDTKNSPGIIMTAKNALVALDEGVIVASRHIHMSPSDAQSFNLMDKDVVSVRLNTERPLVLEDVLVRVDPSFKLAMHIDSDEGNSAAWVKNTLAYLVHKK